MSIYYISENQSANVILSQIAPNKRFERISFDTPVSSINVYLYEDYSPLDAKEINTHLDSVYDITQSKPSFITIYVVNPVSFRVRKDIYTYQYGLTTTSLSESELSIVGKPKIEIIARYF